MKINNNINNVKPILGKRYENNGKPLLKLNFLQNQTKKRIEQKVLTNIYPFESVLCAICHNNDFELLSLKDRYGLKCSVVACKQCGLIQINPRMTQKAYNQFYVQEYRKLDRGQKIPDDAFFMAQYIKAEKICNYLSDKLNTKITGLNVLDVGCGAGGMLHYFKQKGNHVLGLDFGDEYFNFGIKNYKLDLRVGTIQDVKLPWTPNIIIYSHVLEHLLDPIKELNCIRKICNAQTYIYIEVPNVKSLNGWGMDFLRTLQIAHTYYFSLNTLKNLATKAGYTFVAGLENNKDNIQAIFTVSSKNSQYSKNNKQKLENDFDSVVSFLKEAERKRSILTVQNIIFKLKFFIRPRLILLVHHLGLADAVGKVFYKLKYRRFKR